MNYNSLQEAWSFKLGYHGDHDLENFELLLKNYIEN